MGAARLAWARAGFPYRAGYHVTLVTDATAAFSEETIHAAHAINGPTLTHAIVRPKS